jgi:hypothetical protein
MRLSKLHYNFLPCVILIFLGSLSGFCQIDNTNSNNFKSGLSVGVNNQIEAINPMQQEAQFESVLQQRMQRQNENKSKEDLKNKGIINKQELYEKQFASEMAALQNTYAKIDQDLGGFSTLSKSVTIVCRDFALPDGDKVTIFLNDAPAVRFVELTQNFQQFMLPLQQGLNKISFKALNQGSSGPNTAAFMVYDSTGKLLSSNQWNLATGAKAVLTIARDE